MHDEANDPTVPVVDSTCARAHPQIRAVHNQLGRGPALALRAGFAAARGEAVLVTMADASDDPDDYRARCWRKLERGLRPRRRVALHAAAAASSAGRR